MYHIYSLLVKPKYTVNDVKNINKLCHKFVPGPFVHHCLTDDIEQFNGENFCNLIDIKEYNLDTWWNKLLLFKKGMCKENSICMFFDLDSSIVRSLYPILENYDGKLTYATNPHKIRSQYLNSIIYGKHGAHYTMMNSSFMLWKGDNNPEVWDKFSIDPEYYMCKYLLGNDQYMSFEHSNFRLLDEKYITDYQMKRMKMEHPKAIISLKG